MSNFRGKGFENPGLASSFPRHRSLACVCLVRVSIACAGFHAPCGLCRSSIADVPRDGPGGRVPPRRCLCAVAVPFTAHDALGVRTLIRRPRRRAIGRQPPIAALEYVPVTHATESTAAADGLRTRRPRYMRGLRRFWGRSLMRSLAEQTRAEFAHRHVSARPIRPARASLLPLYRSLW
jgi:hypothetical protein